MQCDEQKELEKHKRSFQPVHLMTLWAISRERVRWSDHHLNDKPHLSQLTGALIRYLTENLPLTHQQSSDWLTGYFFLRQNDTEGPMCAGWSLSARTIMDSTSQSALMKLQGAVGLRLGKILAKWCISQSDKLQLIAKLKARQYIIS